METYISVDIETDGPCPGLNSMLSLGAAAFDYQGVMLGTMQVNFELAEGAEPNLSTMKWWETQPEAWKEARTKLNEPKQGMEAFERWVRSYNRPVFMAYPAGFDFTFVKWYFHKYLGHCPFGFNAIDMKTMAHVILGTEFKQTVKRRMPKEWFPTKKHSHIAWEDAVEQGVMYFKMRRYMEAYLESD